jgi:hypothetical protein
MFHTVTLYPLSSLDHHPHCTTTQVPPPTRLVLRESASVARTCQPAHAARRVAAVRDDACGEAHPRRALSGNVGLWALRGSQIIQTLQTAERPQLYVGGGCLHAAEELREFVALTGIPVASTLMGLGTFPGGDELCVDMLGMHGTVAANYSIDKSDLLMAMGVRRGGPLDSEDAIETRVKPGEIVTEDALLKTGIWGCTGAVRRPRDGQAGEIRDTGADRARGH